MKPWAGVCRFGGIGDNLIASSILPLLADKYNVEVITKAPQSVVFENNPYISKLTLKENDQIPQDPEGWQKWFANRAKEYSFFVNLSHSCETILAFGPGQTQFYWSDKWRRQFCNRNYLEFVHDICGLPSPYHPQFFPTSDEVSRAAETKSKVGDRVVGWVLGGSRIDKVYPQTPLVIARLIRELGLSVIMFGSPGRDFEMAKVVEQFVEQENGSGQGLHLALSPDPSNPSWPIRRSLSQLLMCDAVIGPDTGFLWGVAMEDMPKLVLLSHASPFNITAYWNNTSTFHADPLRVSCWPCHKLHDHPSTCRPNAYNNGAACISDIPVDAIVEGVRSALCESSLS